MISSEKWLSIFILSSTFSQLCSTVEWSLPAMSFPILAAGIFVCF